jgi:hypothetical protein
MCAITVRMELNKSNYSSMYTNLVEGTVQLDFLLLFCMNELHLTPFLVSESLPNFASNSRRHSRFSFDSRESTPPDHLVRRVTAFYFFFLSILFKLECLYSIPCYCQSCSSVCLHPPAPLLVHQLSMLAPTSSSACLHLSAAQPDCNTSSSACLHLSAAQPDCNTCSSACLHLSAAQPDCNTCSSACLHLSAAQPDCNTCSSASLYLPAT